ncbi:MAG: hypothetical protein A2Z45_11350 [Chloroflexi bacterium RBG_19FT_COMBO_55_16]|nr:MAG: hypothetical protein A2Z45_11350 [Chloroflexi bacterium RBG_19FT_COMBO_55_16]
MEKIKRHYLLILLGVLASLLVTAAVPLPYQPFAFSSVGKSDLVRLTVDNQSTGSLYLWLDGPSFYYMVVKAKESEVFTVMRGKYQETVKACGDTVKTTLDMSTNQKLIMPKCGSKSVTSGVVDLGHLIKIIKISVENESSTKMIVVLEGPATYVFSFDKDQKKNYTVAKGDYKVTYYACGRTGTRNFSVYKGHDLILDCPK